MTPNNKIAPRESLELHELLTFKSLCATKSATLTAMVTDEVLKTMLQQDVEMSQTQIRDLENLINLSDYSPHY